MINSYPRSTADGRVREVTEGGKSLLSPHRRCPSTILTVAWSGRAGGPGLALESQYQDPGTDHEDADPPPSGRALAEKQEREDRHQHEAQLVDGGHLRRIADFEGTEVADPRGAGGQPGQHQEEPRVRREGERVTPLAGGVHEPGEDDDDDGGANEGRQIGIDTLEPELGEDGGERRERG